MPKFKVEATRVDEYLIELDEKVWTPEALKDWAKTFYPTTDLKHFAEHVASAIMFNGSANGFMEGFGYVKCLRPDGSIKNQFTNGFTLLPLDQYTDGIVVTIITEEDDFEYDVKTI